MNINEIKIIPKKKYIRKEVKKKINVKKNGYVPNINDLLNQINKLKKKKINLN